MMAVGLPAHGPPRGIPPGIGPGMPPIVLAPGSPAFAAARRFAALPALPGTPGWCGTWPRVLRAREVTLAQLP